MSVENNDVQVAIIGTGPIGLECGLQSLKTGYKFVLFESGNDIAENVRSWSHVRLFTPLEMNISRMGREQIQTKLDMNAFLTGQEYIEQYLRPISDLFRSNILLNHRVISVGRHNSNQFILLVENNLNRSEEYFIANCVIDASGTFSSPNFTGDGYLPAINERLLRSKNSSLITSKMPTINDERLAGKRILLIGKGHSAATSALILKNIKENYPRTELFWIIKQKVDNVPYCVNQDDPLEQRRILAENLNEIYRNKKIFTKIFTNSTVKKFVLSDKKTSVDVLINGSTEEILPNIDFIVSNTGSKPDRDIYENLSVHECYRTKGPMALAVKLLGSSGQDCLKQTSHGPSSMLTTETNFFIVGNKSYGRQVNFLMKIGFEQVDDIFQLIQQNFHQSINI